MLLIVDVKVSAYDFLLVVPFDLRENLFDTMELAGVWGIVYPHPANAVNEVSYYSAVMGSQVVHKDADLLASVFL